MRAAAVLGRQRRARKPPARLFFLTDPERTPDPEAIAERLPRGAAIVYRAFGAPDAEPVARRLRAIARRRGLLLLIGADERLAARVGAHGLHLPERLAAQAPAIRARRPGWVVTAAAHSEVALRRAARARVDAAIVSSLFTSRSGSAGRALGPARFAQLVRTSHLPVIALGGVKASNARRALATGAAGLAAVEAWTR